MRKLLVEGVMLLFCVALSPALNGCADSSQSSVRLDDDTSPIYDCEIVPVLGT